MYTSAESSSKRIREVVSRTQRRANHSDLPNRYMSDFERGLNLLLDHGVEALPDYRSGWQDPVHVAAEVEALCAFRALKNWGTGKGLYLNGKYKMEMRDAA